MMARTDNDTWDLASSVGATATMVAAQRALSHREGLIDDPFAEPLVQAVGMDFTSRFFNGEIDLTELDPELNLRHFAEHMAVRTRFFDTLFTDAAAAGVHQAVILASGLDARAYRLPWPDGTTVYEVDQPEVIEFKSRTLAELGAKPTADRRTVAIDLRHDWPQALIDNGFDSTQPTAWIAEGLLIYLPSEAQDKLFDNITALSVPGSWVATERVHDMKAFFDERAQRMADQMKKYGTDVNVADLIYEGERSHVVEYLSTYGWDVSSQTMEEAYAANGFEMPEGDAMSAVRELSYISAVLR
jgi:methyltransferase (TIGR00027 family)